MSAIQIAGTVLAILALATCAAGLLYTSRVLRKIERNLEREEQER